MNRTSMLVLLGALSLACGTVTEPGSSDTNSIEDDDGGTTGSDPLVTFTLNAGETAVVVQSGFNNTDVGPYTMTISAT